VEEAKALFVSWLPYHGRSDGIARSLGVQGWFSDGGTGPAFVRDVRRWRQTSRLLRSERPDVILVMQPPVIALWCVWWYARRAKARIAGDLHTGVFTEASSRIAMRHTLRLLGRHGLAIVTNGELREVADAHLCPTLILHDRIEALEPDTSTPENAALAELADDEFVLAPLAYDHNDPVDEILRAAAATPELRWVLTGDPPRGVVAQAPANVTFPGFVSRPDFLRAMSRAGVVVAMTKHEHTMQRAAYEALSLGRPLVTSDTTVLSAYYADAAELVAPRAEYIAHGVRRAMADEGASERMVELRDLRISEQDLALASLQHWVSAGGR
jgi:glycosyltransferase involved in cell wall biosynthesis